MPFKFPPPSQYVDVMPESMRSHKEFCLFFLQLSGESAKVEWCGLVVRMESSIKQLAANRNIVSFKSTTSSCRTEEGVFCSNLLSVPCGADDSASGDDDNNDDGEGKCD
jgi:hypothetical protein